MGTFLLRRFKAFKTNAFSLVELLITLIIISLLIAAFVPLITKKLKANDITVGSFGKGDVVNTILERQVTKADCEKYDAIFVPAGINGGTRNLCVTKYNMGDNALPLAKSTKKLSPSQACPTSDSGNCCWSGTTSSNCSTSGNEGADYSGCNRTVCQYQAANASCASYAPNDENEGRWRLPNDDELKNWSSNLVSINNNMGKEGLQLCDLEVSNLGSVMCAALENSCKNVSDGSCSAGTLWTMTSSNEGQYYARNLQSGSLNQQNYSTSKAASTRCVLDSIEVELSDISGITNPTTNPFYGEPQDQADCDKIVAIFIDKKYSGANRNICVSKYNVGDAGPDGFGPPIPSEFEQYTMAVGQSCTYSGSCCWQGKTAGTCGIDGNEGANYSGCNRTVCQWNAANAACRQYTAFGATKAGAWRLPKSSEVSVWQQHLDIINNNLGTSGLQLCSHNAITGFVRCANGTSCLGAEGNYCRTHHIWTETPASNTNFYHFYTSTATAMASSNLDYTGALSSRCVYDGITSANNDSSDLDDYDDSNAPSDEPKSQEECDKLTAIFVHKKYAGGERNLCVSKYNVGDTGASGSGPTIPSSYTNYIMNVGQTCPLNGYCCWRGKTAGTCGMTGNVGANYSGCNRTVCQWHAANEACLSWTVGGKTQMGAWRLPTQAEVSSMANYLNIINNDKGPSGLQLCSHNAITGFVRCANGTSCLGAEGNYCRTHHIWTETPASNTNFYHFYTSTATAMASSNLDYTGALSSRCVYDGTVRKFEEITDYDDDSSAPSDEPKSQEDCDKLSSIFIHKKYTGEGRNICITRYNIGDSGPNGYGPSVPDEYKQYSLSAGQSCTKGGYCCWKGTTSGTCGMTGNAGADYSGCGRTVCQWDVANETCKIFTANGKTKAGYWRLPRNTEFGNLAANLPYINNNKGASGIQLCSHNTLAGFVRCANGTSCLGADGNYCRVHHIWTETVSSGKNHYNYNTSSPTSMSNGSLGVTGALSSRCVYDGLDYSTE